MITGIFRDASRPLAGRVAHLLSRMTREEKIARPGQVCMLDYEENRSAYPDGVRAVEQLTMEPYPA